MFTHLLVPLDGSPQAEPAVPAAIWLARRHAAAVTVLHLVEPAPPEQVHGAPHLRGPEEAAAYLDGVLRRYAAPGLALHAHVHPVGTADVAQGIVAELQELGGDAVVMSRQGPSGWRGWLMGNLMQQVAAKATLPVLLVRPGPAGAEPFACTRILMPHDEAPEHEPALEVGVAFAQICAAEVRLLRVVPTRGTLSGKELPTSEMLPTATAAMLDLEQAEAVRQLEAHRAALERQGVSATGELMRGDPVRCIMEASRRYRPDVIAMGTHGRAGTEAFWAGSVAARVCDRSSASVLLVPLAKPAWPTA